MAKKILTQGIVQGVGFRPYIYRLAKDLNLNGYVRNLGNVVEIILEGDNIDLFIDRLPKELPPIAKIDSMKTEDIAREGFDDFTIIESSDEFSGVSVIPPDIAVLKKLEIRKTDVISIPLMHVLTAAQDLLLLTVFLMTESELQWTNFHCATAVLKNMENL